MKRALITGITGQDGSYLAEYLLSLGYEVHGIVRRVALEQPDMRLGRIMHIKDRVVLHPASLESYPSIFNVVSKHKFDECYHLAAQSFVAESFGDGFSTMNTNTNGTHFVLAALRELQPKCRFYFAGSSEMFGKVHETPQTEVTPFHPRSPYGISKVAGFYLTLNYREAYDMFCCNGILFNHESPRRGETFVTRKISLAAAKIYLGLQDSLTLGNLEAKRDWGYAPEYVHAMWQMMQAKEPLDLVIATGVSTTVKEFAKIAFQYLGLDAEKYIRFSESYIRPTEVEDLLGDSSKAEKTIGWKASTHWKELAEIMVKADVALIENQLRGSSAF